MIEMRIVDIGADELQRRNAKIRPVVSRNGKLYYLRPYSLREIRTTSYYDTCDRDIIEPVKENTLEVLEGCDFLCLHPYDYADKEKRFRPTVADVLRQISRRHLWWVKAFEIIEEPQGVPSGREDTFPSIAFNSGYHVSKVRLYGARK